MSPCPAKKLHQLLFGCQKLAPVYLDILIPEIDHPRLVISLAIQITPGITITPGLF